MIGVTFDYASPSALLSDRERALLGFTGDARRPVRFHGRIRDQVPLVRFALRALGSAIWSRDSWASDGDAVLDPVVTVHPDRVFFEAFSGDQSAYVNLILDRTLFETAGEVHSGTTNIDFTAWLWGALGELRSRRETWLRIDSAGLAVETQNGGGRFEPKVELPDAWVRGFFQLHSAMTLPGTRLSVRPVDLLAAIRFLSFTKAKLSPRALRYEFVPGQDARIVLEPWEHPVPLRGVSHGYTATRVVRTWGRRRLALLEPLLPFADRVDVYLKGRGQPSFYAVKLTGITFVLGLSPWSGQSWSDAADLDPGASASRLDPALLAAVHGALAARTAASAKDLAADLGQASEVTHAALARLCRRGRCIYDLETRAFRHRELFADPLDEDRLYPIDPRLEQAERWVREGTVQVTTCEPQETRKERHLRTPDGTVARSVVYRDWRVEGEAGGVAPVSLVINDRDRVIFGTCGCAFFQENLLSRGPCAHMVALHRASAERRVELPSSYAVPRPAEGANDGGDLRDAALDPGDEGDET